MYNQCILMGRICQDLVLKTTQSGISVLSFTIAVDRSFAAKGEERKSDFFNVVAWRANAEFISRYFAKGRMILISGELQTRQYVDKNNSTQHVVEIIVDRASFTGEPKQNGQNSYVPPNHPSDGNIEIANPQGAARSQETINYADADSNDVNRKADKIAAERGIANTSHENFSKKEDFIAATNDTDDYPF